MTEQTTGIGPATAATQVPATPQLPVEHAASPAEVPVAALPEDSQDVSAIAEGTAAPVSAASEAAASEAAASEAAASDGAASDGAAVEVADETLTAPFQGEQATTPNGHEPLTADATPDPAELPPTLAEPASEPSVGETDVPAEPDPAEAGAVAPPASEPVAEPTQPSPAATEPLPTAFAHAHGRVAVDGTVFVIRPDGQEVAVGQWAAGDPAQGLAFFERKFAGLLTEGELLVKRLHEGKASPEAVAAVVAKLRESVETPHMVGDLAQLSGVADQLQAAGAERRAQISEQRARDRAKTAAEREAIVSEAEQLSSATKWKATGERFKELQAKWSALPRAERSGREAEQELWRRFSAARSAFDKARRGHFAQLDATRKEATTVKEQLIARAVELSNSADWADTARAYRSLMDEWKAAPRAGRTEEDKLWARFRAAQDVFFDARTANASARDGDQRANAIAKEALAVEAETLLPISDIAAARTALRNINERWGAIGHVPRSERDGLENRLKRVEDAARRYEEDQWRRTDPAKRALAESTASTFQASLEKLEKQLAAAEAAGNTRKANELASRVEQTRMLLAAAQRSVADFGG
ncbi:MAG: DUF349 domain-containing protein [Candidatus Nanopelagicales bacterium]